MQDFEEFYARTFAKVLAAVTMITCNLPVAEDAVQDAYVEAYEFWDEVADHDAPPEAWVITVAVRRAWKIQAKDKRRAELSRRVRVPPQATPEQTTEANEVLDALASLPPKMRTVMIMHDVLGHQQPEVAKMLHVSRGTVSRHVDAGRRLLRSRLGIAGPVPGSRDALIPVPQLRLGFPIIPDRDPLTAALVRTQKWLQDGIAANPDTASKILARIKDPETEEER